MNISNFGKPVYKINQKKISPTSRRATNNTTNPTTTKKIQTIKYSTYTRTHTNTPFSFFPFPCIDSAARLSSILSLVWGPR